MNATRMQEFVDAAWSSDSNNKGPVITALEHYITIPNISPAYDPDWAQSNNTDNAVTSLVDGIKSLIAFAATQNIPADDITISVLSTPENPVPDAKGNRRTPLMRVDIPAFGAQPPKGTILLYGHLDKQPGLADRWSSGLNPYTPVIRDDKLYGRGGADDGYAPFSALTAILAVRAQGLAHAKSTIIVEAAEESGGDDVDFYVKEMQAELGDVRLVVCLDSGAGDYDHLWTTASLRGMFGGILRIGVMREGIHSGDASGIVPSPFRILRQLLSRVEDQITGEVTVPELKVDIPEHARKQAEKIASIKGEKTFNQFPFLDGVKPISTDIQELILNREWRAAMVVKGMDGIPANSGAGNVMLPDLAAALSFRLPPTVDAEKAAQAVKRELEKEPPFGAKVEFAIQSAGNGFAAPHGIAWYSKALEAGARDFFGGEALAIGEGGSIPFMNLLAGLFPNAAFLVTGVLGPGSNAHGPDECLHLPFVRKLTGCVASIIAAQALE